MAQKNTKRKTSTSTTRSKSKVSKSGFGRVVPNKWVAVIFIAIIAGLGSYFVFFSQAAPLNCQNDGTVPVCDVDMVSGDTDTILSMGTEAKDLGAKKWGLYFPATFRAPVKQLRGSVPVYRVYNKAATYHDWVVDTEKATKDAKYDIEVQGTPFHAWKTQVEGTVPVYRISRGESHSQSIFSTDKAWVDKMLAAGKDDPKGWKRDVFGKFIAFYAYPPNYKVANQVNPYDCSIAANFTSDRCTIQRENLQEATQSGSILQTPSATSGSDPASSMPNSNTENPESPPEGGPTPVITKPISKIPQKPDPKKFDECPVNAKNPDAALLVYIDGVNKKKKNYSTDCHKFYWVYAQKRQKEEQLKSFYQAIIDCEKSVGPTGHPRKFYDFGCHDWTPQEISWFNAVNAARVTCLDKPGKQDFNPSNLHCADVPVPPSNQQVPSGGGGGKPPTEPISRARYRCEIHTGVFFGWNSTKPIGKMTKYYEARNLTEARQGCVMWLNYINGKPEYNGFDTPTTVRLAR